MPIAIDSIALTNTLELLLFPPNGNFLLIAIGGMCWYLNWKRGAYPLWMFSVLSLYLMSTPHFGNSLLEHLERYPALTMEDLARNQDVEAIVILGAGRTIGAPEYGGHDTVNRWGLERLRYGAWLQRHTGLPILVAGGSVMSDGPSEAAMMREVLVNEMHVPVRWVEEGSRTTRENAINSKRILVQTGIEKVYVVTQAWHMPRAAQVFGEARLKMVPAPTAFTHPGSMEQGVAGWIPSAHGLELTARALHEIVGRWWYAWLR